MHLLTGRVFIAITAAAALITWNHFYVLGPKALILGVAIATVAAVLLTWIERARSRVALFAFSAFAAWLVAGFGLYKGFYTITLPLYFGTLLSSLSTIFPRPTLGNFGYEASGLLMFIASLSVARYSAELAFRSAAQGGRRVGAAVAITLAVMLGIYTWRDADRFIEPARGVVKIGVIVPTDGPYAILGTSFLRAVEMAKADAGDTRYRYELVVINPGSDPTKARDIVARAIRGGNVDALLGGISLIGQQTKLFATAERIPHLCVCTVKTIGDGAYNFTNIPAPEAEATLWVKEAKRRGITRVALITQSYPSIVGHVTALKAEAARQGLAITSDQTFNDSVRDFVPHVARARASRPDVYYVEALEPWLDRLAEQLAAAGIRNLASVVAPSVSTRPQLFEGVWYTDSNLRDFGFKRRFEQKYPGAMFATHMMPYAYDNFRLIVAAYEHRQNPAVYLRNLTQVEGTAGPIRRERGSGNFQSSPAVWVIRNGAPALVR